MERNYPKATITEKGERALRGGHPWVYADEVTEVSGEYENGGLADVFSRKGRYLGTGYINDNSKIRIRVISRNTLSYKRQRQIRPGLLCPQDTLRAGLPPHRHGRGGFPLLPSHIRRG